MEKIVQILKQKNNLGFRIARSIIFPLIVFALAGICMLIGMHHPNQFKMQDAGVWENASFIFWNVGVFIFTQGFGVVLAASIVAGMNLKDSGTAILATVLSVIVFTGTIAGIAHGFSTAPHTAMSDWVHVTTTEQRSVFQEYSSFWGYDLGFLSISVPWVTGIVFALIVPMIHTTVRDIKLPKILGFFQGVRFVAIVTIITAGILGIIAFYIFYDFVLPANFPLKAA